MTSEMRQHRAPEHSLAAAAAADGAGEQLASIRADADQIFAVASDVFERVRATNSEDFLRRSRQTGGQ